MAENKADKALKEAHPINTIKVYYNGKTPADCGHDIVSVPTLDNDTQPWLVKWYTDETICHQFVDANAVYKSISTQLGTILDAVIVNNKQRESVSLLVDKMLYELLMRDHSNENDIVI